MLFGDALQCLWCTSGYSYGSGSVYKMWRAEDDDGAKKVHSRCTSRPIRGMLALFKITYVIIEEFN